MDVGKLDAIELEESLRLLGLETDEETMRSVHRGRFVLERAGRLFSLLCLLRFMFPSEQQQSKTNHPNITITSESAAPPPNT